MSHSHARKLLTTICTLPPPPLPLVCAQPDTIPHGQALTMSDFGLHAPCTRPHIIIHNWTQSIFFHFSFFGNLSNMQGRSKPPFFWFFSFLFFSFGWASFLHWLFFFFFFSFFIITILFYNISLCASPSLPLSLSRMDLSHMDILRGLVCWNGHLFCLRVIPCIRTLSPHRIHTH